EATVSRRDENQRVCYSTPRELVSLIIPTRDRGELLERCLRSISQKTAYQPYEIILLDNGTTEQRARQVLQATSHDPRIRVVSAEGEFNYSKLCNSGASLAGGRILLLLNNDIEVITNDWLSEIASQIMRPEAGIVGTRLLFPDHRVQHAGIILN